MKFASAVFLLVAIVPTAASADYDVQPPALPRACEAPAGAIRVSTVSELGAAMAQTKPRDILLTDGTYAPAAKLLPAAGHRLWGSHASRVIVLAGIALVGKGANKVGAQINCLTIDVRSASKAANISGTANVHVSGNFRDVRIADSVLLGNRVINRGIFAQRVDGLVLERVVVRDFNLDGIRAQPLSRTHVANPPMTMRDLDIANVARPKPGSSTGKAEAGIWFGNRGMIERVRIRNAFWSGIETVTNAIDITIRDADIDGSGHALYIEHYTKRLLLERFHFGPKNGRGVTLEWDDPKRYSGAPAGEDNTIQDGLIEAYRVGVAIMDGTKGTTVRRMTFRNQCLAAIVAGRPRSKDEVLEDNDFSGIDAGAATVSSKHPNTSKCT
jgi:hypothetical protein